ncbi:GlxA family transcriptional regulator [Mesorhizobium sp.]|uniref:GlxA family transcriptional regulator n=1 Tax=Mesorhizobium sp. TaxID=1871066 RepID=UPI0025E14D62|nr:GlxA family transcriptional regulator [Mesorhizobium sp.]
MLQPIPRTQHFAFLLADKFSMYSLAAAIDTLRVANRFAGGDVYSWTTVSAAGDPVVASNDLPIKIDYAISDLQKADILFACLGVTTDFSGKSKALAALRTWGRRGAALGGLSVGAYLLAEAGQLDGHRCTIHWEYRAGFLENFPDIDCTSNVYEIDRKRYSCAGGTTSTDLMLEIVRRDLGPEMANRVANYLQHDRIRSSHDRQRVGQERDLNGVSDKLQKILRFMADSFDSPYSAKALAREAGISVRQVERLFLRHLKTPPGRYFMRMRLERARELLHQTNMPILNVAMATGFTSHSYFAQSYRSEFGRPPSEDRRQTY